MIHWQDSNSGETLPLVALPDTIGSTPQMVIDWASGHRAEWLPRLLRHGALLFQGFGFDSIDLFESFARVFSLQLVDYTGGASSRKKVQGKVYTSTEASPQLVISQHHEGAYLPEMPSIISFICLRPAARGGCTPLAAARKVTARIPKAVLETFRERRVQYVNRLHGGLGIGRSWQAQFETDDRVAVESILTRGGYEFAWLPNGALVTRVCCDAIKCHPQTGELLWIAQAEHWHPSGLDPATRRKMAQIIPESEFPFNCYYGDGGTLDEQELALIRSAIRAETITFPWQKGDVLVCDNLLVSHGRESFEGERQVYVALG